MAETAPHIEPWFWDLLSRSWLDEDALRTSLEELDDPLLEKFVVYFHLANQYTRDPWDGPYISEVGGELSEDSTEDLNDWIVVQGFSAWNYARSVDANWDELFRLANHQNAGSTLAEFAWHKPDLRNTECFCVGLRHMAVEVYECRFKVDFSELESELYVKYDP